MTRSDPETRSARKHRAIQHAASALFVSKGYDGTNVEDIATKAGVSKQTVYKHYGDKERLFAETVLATTDRVDHVITLVTGALADTQDLEQDLGQLGRQFITMLMEPELLQLRRLVIANAERMPKLGRSWFEQGFERVLATLASCFERLTQKGLLRMDDPPLAAHHFVGLLLWIPLNEAMFTGSNRALGKVALDRYVDAAVRVFLAAYGGKSKISAKPSR